MIWFIARSFFLLSKGTLDLIKAFHIDPFRKKFKSLNILQYIVANQCTHKHIHQTKKQQQQHTNLQCTYTNIQHNLVESIDMKAHERKGKRDFFFSFGTILVGDLW